MERRVAGGPGFEPRL